jgi:hypothetical protein
MFAPVSLCLLSGQDFTTMGSVTDLLGAHQPSAMTLKTQLHNRDKHVHALSQCATFVPIQLQSQNSLQLFLCAISSSETSNSATEMSI